MSLETLPDELLLLISSYLSAFDVLQSFNDLNTRLNTTINAYRRHIDLSRVRYGQFNHYCRMLNQSSFGSGVHSLILSNLTIPCQIEFFIERVWPIDEKLPNLERLALDGIYSSQLDIFVPKMLRLKRLTDLTIEHRPSIYGGVGYLSSIFFQNVMRSIDSLRRISLRNVGLSLPPIFDWNNNTITHLTAGIDGTVALVAIMNAFPSLQLLSVDTKTFQAPDGNR
jgi:hypothetical protein